MRRVLLLITLGLPLAFACAEPPPSGDPPIVLPPDAPDAGVEPDTCETDDDCAFGKVCTNNACVVVAPGISDEGCQSDADCGADERCALTTGQCIPNAAAPNPPPPQAGECVSGETRFCGEKRGACEYGVETCVGGAWSGDCVGGVGPTAETCNNIDDDCDGVVDEDVPPAPCTSGLGECARSGTATCLGAGVSQCDALPGLPVTEICDNLDNDCNGINDNGCDDDGDGFCDASLAFVQSAACAGSNLGLGLDCNDNNRDIHPEADEICFDAFDQNCDGDPNDGCNCDPTIDADFDGVNQCLDCDDTNGAVKPLAVERCDGIDNNCDLQIDEGFDADGDGFTTCGTLPGGGGTAPELVDCNDNNADIKPGGCELCADANGDTLTCGELGVDGNNVDEDCDGFVDENCTPCDPVDRDGDGVSECEGDCEPDVGTVFPGQPEICDGFDTDCNRNTVDNCAVGEDCDHPEFTDACEEGLFCVESLGGGGNPTGNFTCTSSCNFSELGLGLGDGCQADQLCGASLTPSANQHGCQVATDFGSLLSGADCGSDSECRSGSCVDDPRTTGRPDRTCVDFCGSDAYCKNGSKCINLGDTGRCFPTLATREPFNNACAADVFCQSFACVDFGGGNNRCTDVCCTDSDCPGGFHCGVEGTGSPGPIGGVDTVPVCMPDDPGNTVANNRQRPAGAACAANNECASEFCDANLGVCVQVCCNDATCPTGLSCEDVLVNVDLQDISGQTFARMCLSQTPADPLEKVP